MSRYNFTGRPVLGGGLARAQGFGGSPIEMKRLLPIFAAVTLLAAIAASGASARPQSSISAARGFSAGQVVVKLDGQDRGQALSLPAGAAVQQMAQALRRNPRVAYAEPNYIATASEAGVESPYVIPNDPGTLEDGVSEAASANGSWAYKQWNFLPWTGAV
ncbi:MAG TPA: hypothetical protein VGQ28_17515, partial [Thermoanaerobaculia bacterium]|nr:hypothetical protein [Thermoanaerobaculia bacterium]